MRQGEQRTRRTFIPKAPISIPYLPLPNLNQIKHGDAQPDIVQNLVGINSVDLTDERLVCRDTELVRFDRDGILPEGTSRVVFYNETGNELAYLDYGQDEHPGSGPQDRITSSRWLSALHRGKQRRDTWSADIVADKLNEKEWKGETDECQYCVTMPGHG